MKNKIMILILFLLMIILIVALIFFGGNKNKGGEDALTVFSVGSSELIISDATVSITLTGEERDKVVDVVENIVNNMSENVGNKNEYDVTIDFKNGYKAYISSEKSLLYFEEEIKNVKAEDLEFILSYLQNK
ncbi:MAG: hypothetical protein ACLRZ9_00850 [Eubacterium sp.]